MAVKTLDDQAIFEVARKIGSPEARQAYLTQICGADLATAGRIEALLQAHDESASFLESPPSAIVAIASPTIDEPLLEKPGTQIGPYKLLQQIGEGGMGVVYMAEQTEPVQRKVALKLIKPGMDSRQIIARFEAERQALAMMDHVNIARVLDAGTTGGEPGGVSPGRPYFVMELVHGVPITKYCDDNHLTPRQRLELFVPVCQAIQHAHQKGIIHRDIKPSNVMVTLYDGKPVPKVIDFGVAKATEQKLTERTLFTQYGTMVGTLEYMSPEQAEMSALGIDTRSDIYSLGVLLYELLTGSTPLSSKRMKEAAYAEILRLIKEEEPPKPSTRLSESGEALASISAQRHMEPAKLSKLMRGELDWIVMKTLEKDRNRRYETASAFAADLQHYLHDEPVQACPPSMGYRFRKFVRRNRGAVAVASAAIMVVLLALVGLAVSNVLIAHERNEKAAALEQSRRSEQRVREQLRRTDDALNLGLVAIDEVGGPWHFREYDDWATNSFLLPEELFTSRRRQNIYGRLIECNPDIESGGFGTAIAYWWLGEGYLGRGEFKPAEEAFRVGLSRLAPLATDSEWSECRTTLAESHFYLGVIFERTARPAEAEQAYREMLRIAADLQKHPGRWQYWDRELPVESYHCAQLAWGYTALGRVLQRTGRLAEAEAAYRQALMWVDKQWPGFKYTMTRAAATRGLGEVLLTTGRTEEAEVAFRDVCHFWEQAVAEYSGGDRLRRWHLAAGYDWLGGFLYQTNRREAAVEVWRKAIPIWDSLVAEHPTVPAYLRQLAWFLANCPKVELRDPTRAVALAAKALERTPSDPSNLTALAAAHYRAGNWGEAQAALDKATGLRPWGEGLDWFLLALVRWQAGDKVGARQWYEKAVEWMAKNDVHNDELRRLRAEAAELLGVNPPADK
ncbi:MAG: protein kinase domain-containing protein [Pirellulaceae bacterium]